MPASYNNAGLLAYMGKLQRAEDQLPAKFAEDFVIVVKSNIIDVGAVDTGELRDSVTANGNTVAVGANHAGYVNYGTYKMAAMPFWEPSIADMGRRIPMIAIPYLSV